MKYVITLRFHSRVRFGSVTPESPDRVARRQKVIDLRKAEMAEQTRDTVAALREIGLCFSDPQIVPVVIAECTPEQAEMAKAVPGVVRVDVDRQFNLYVGDYG